MYSRKLSLALILCVAIVNTLPTNNLVKAQTTTSFSANTPFSIPEYNGTIYFSENGTYSSATLENNTWVFTDLRLSTLRTLKAFNVSIHDCNITLRAPNFFVVYNITDYENSRDYTGYLFTEISGMITYNVTGTGTQSFNFGLGPSFGLDYKYRDMMVLLDTDIFGSPSPEGEGWKVARDVTIIITGATTSATITYANYSQTFNADTPFYQRHSVTITALALVTIMAALSASITVKRRKEQQNRRYP